MKQVIFDAEIVLNIKAEFPDDDFECAKKDISEELGREATLEDIQNKFNEIISTGLTEYLVKEVGKDGTVNVKSETKIVDIK